MNAVSKASAFPATVQPGLPKHGKLPTGWSREPIGKHLREVRRPLSMDDDEIFQLVTAKRARGGIVPREELSGREISVKSQFRIEEGDFLISKRQIVHGACGLVPKELDGAVVSNEYAVLRPCQSIDPRFVSYLSHSIYFQQTCFHSSIGVHIEKMIFKLDKWLGWEFDLPPLPEQKKIAEILSIWDRAIETTEKLLANAEAQKQALMQQLLTGKRRLKGFEESEWRSVALGHVWKVTTGQPAPNNSDDFYSKGAPFLRVSCLAPLLEGTSESSFEKVPPATVDRYRLKLFPAGTVVFAKSGMSAKLGRVYRLLGDAYLVSHLAALLPNPSKGDERFLFYHFQMFPPSDLIQGDGFPSIKTSLIAERRIDLPPLPEQSAIANCLDASEQVAANYRAQVALLASEKRALMQQLLTGKRRVKP